MSYIEWILVDTLLGYEVGDMEKSFLLLFRSLDLDGSGQIDAGELEVVLRMLLETRDGLSDGGDFASGFGHGGERAHVGRDQCLPAEILVEGTGALKHLGHELHLSDVPVADVLIEREAVEERILRRTDERAERQ